MSKIIIYIYNIIPSILKNRYVLSTIFFLIWISFFDANSLSTQLKQKQEIQQLKQDIIYYQDEIKKDNLIIDIVSNDTLTPKLEKYLRENLFLSKNDEEVFIIE